MRIWHPGLEATVINDTLKLTSHPVAPSRASYWRHRYDNKQDCASADFIHQAATALMPHKLLFHRISLEGGRAEFFIGWASKQNFGDVFPYDTLRLLAELKISLSFDVYPDAADIG